MLFVFLLKSNKSLCVLCLQVVLNNATVETDNPDLRDRAYIYWRLLSTDPEVGVLSKQIADVINIYLV